MRLQAKVALVITVIIVSLTTVLSYVAGWKASTDIKDKAGLSLSETAFQLASRLDQYMWGRAGEVQVLSALPEFRRVGSREEAERLLMHLQSTFPAFSWIGVTDKEGQVWAATDGILVGQSLVQRPVYTEGIKGEFVGDVHEAVLLRNLLPNPTGEPMKFVDISQAVQDGQGNTVGVLAAHLSWKWAAQLEQAMFQTQRERNEEEIFIVSANDQTVLLGPKEFLGQKLDLQSVKQAQQGTHGWVEETWPDGRTYLVGYRMGAGYLDYKGLGWTILVRQPAEVAFASVYRLQWFLWIVGVIASAVFGIIGWMSAGAVSRPLQEIAKAADHLRFGAQEERFSHKGVKEIETLADLFNHLLDNLTTAERHLLKMEVIAYNDPLTGLANRVGLDTFVKRAQALASRQVGISLAMLYLDLDGFKQVNDTYGHAAGDQVLKEVAMRLEQCIRKEEFVSRIGGDEFVIILFLSRGQERDMLQAVGDRIISTVGQPIAVEGGLAQVGCSIGGVLWEEGLDLQQVMKKADTALYRVKRTGKNRLEING